MELENPSNKLPEKSKNQIEIKSEFSSFVPENFKNDPFGYFEKEGKNIKPGEIKYKESGEISEDPTAVKNFPIWKNIQNEELEVVGKRVNTAKSEVRHSGDAFYEYHIMELAREFDLPCLEPIGKIESNNQFLFLTKKANGIKGFEKEMVFLKEKGYTDANINSIKEQAEKMTENLKAQYDSVGIIRKWELKDMIFDVDLETKTVKSVTPTDFEKTKIDQSKFFEAREKKQEKISKNDVFTDLNNELNQYTGPTNKRALEEQISKIQDEYLSVADKIAFPNESNEELIKKMNEEIEMTKKRFLTYENNRGKLNNLNAINFVDELISIGADISNENKEKAIQLLTSSEINHINRSELAILLGINENVGKQLAINRNLFDRYGEILKEQLREENEQIFFGSEIKFIDHRNIEIDGETIDAQDLNDPELAHLDQKELQKIVQDIIEDKEGTASQGTCWNVLISEKLPFVLKTERKLKTEEERQYRKESLLRYPIIRKSVGREFLPKQLVFQTKNSEQAHLLQEKISLKKMIGIRDTNIDKLIDGYYGEKIISALQKDENKKTLNDFINGAERLYSEHKLVIDTLGDNLFFNIKEDGLLEIKLIDYGAFKQQGEKPNEDIKKVLDFFGKLKKLT